MNQSSRVPDCGDVVWIDFNPQAGREQAGRRPAVVLSPERYSGRVGLAMLCPVTTQVKGYPFEVAIPDGMAITGVILSDQIKSLDWRRRNAEIVTRLPPAAIVAVLENVRAPVARMNNTRWNLKNTH